MKLFKKIINLFSNTYLPFEDKPIDREYYSKRQSELEVANVKTYEQFDKSILTLSSAALGLAVTQFNKWNITSMEFRWIVFPFTISIVSVVIGFLVSASGVHDEIENTSKILNENSLKNLIIIHWQMKVVTLLNLLSLSAFVIGVIAMVVVVSNSMNLCK